MAMLLFGGSAQRRPGVAWLGAVLLTLLLSSSAQAATIEYEIGTGPTGLWSEGFGHLVSGDLSGLLTLETDSPLPLAAGQSVSVLGLDVVGTGQLCSCCDAFDISIQLDPQAFQQLAVTDTSFKEGNRLTLQGVLGLLFTLDFGGGNVVNASVEAVTSIWYGVLAEDEIFTAFDLDPDSWEFLNGDPIDPSSISFLKLGGDGRPVDPVPEPLAIALLGVAAAGLAGFRRRGA